MFWLGKKFFRNGSLISNFSFKTQNKGLKSRTLLSIKIKFVSKKIDQNFILMNDNIHRLSFESRNKSSMKKYLDYKMSNTPNTTDLLNAAKKWDFYANQVHIRSKSPN